MAEQSDRNFFGRLKKLFSTTAIVRVDSDGKRRVVDVDDRQMNTNLLQLKDRYSKLQRSFYETHAGAQSMAYHQVRRELFREYDSMDDDPIIASALDIYADECLGGETVIPLLNGEKLTIEQLYKSGARNFWVYGLDSNGDFTPVQAEKVAHNGKKSVRKIILEDNSELWATDNHIWVNTNRELIKTKDLKVGDGLYTLSTRITEGKHMKGYEQIETSYKKYSDFVRSSNHRIKFISKESVEMDVYDLVNAGSNHIYAIETADGGKLYTHNCTTKNEYGEVLQIKSSNENVKEILENLFYDILNIEFNLWPWTRNLTKYGDFFLGLEIAEGKGVINVIPQSVYYAERLEGYDPNNANSVKFKVEQDRTGKIDWENYEMAHFRLLSDTNFLPYGKSMIESGRRVWKQLCLAADSKIWTDGGYKYISQINIGDVVYSYDYTLNTLVPTRVKNHQLTGNKPVYEVKTGHRTIRGTYEHPIMVANGVYKNIGELNTSDYIIVGNHAINTDSKLPKLQVDESLFVAKFNDDFYSTNLLNNKQVCNECGSNFGRLTGNHLKTHNLNVDEYYDRYDIDTDFAGLFYRNTRISYKSAIRYCDMMNISTDNLDIFLNKCNNTIIPEPIILEHISLFIRFIGFMLGDGWLEDNTVCFSLGDKLTKSMKYVELMEKLNASYRIRNEGLSKADCVVSSTYLRTLLTDVLDFRTGTFNKILPNWVYELPLELRREFLYGFADADGTPINNGYSVGGVNKAMLEALHTLAQQAGFTTTNFRTGSDTYDNKSIMYGFEFSDSQYHMQTDENGVLIEKIRSIKVLPPIDVYDIEVDNELHNFISDGVVAHNCLMEDAMLIHRIMRAPEKRVFKIDIGNINPTEVDNYMQKIINKMKKVPFVNKDTGDYNLKYNMQNLTEDFFLPVRGGDSGTSIENLGGLEYAATEDIEFLQKKLFASLKVPKAYLSYDESINGKATLAAEDVRFARTIERIQRTIVSELTKIAIVHLAAQGIDDSEMVNFELTLTNASTIYEQEKVNLWSEKVRLATDMAGLKMLSKDWVYSNVFAMSDADRDTEKVRIISDLKDTFRHTSIETDGNDPAEQPEPTDIEGELEELKNEIGNRKSGGVGGRPREGNTYGKDKHPYGRDPLGDGENHKERRRETTSTTNNKKLAREYINGMSAKKKIIVEKRDFLDETNLLDDSKIQ